MYVCSMEVAAEVGPVISEARTLARFIAPLQERLWSLARNLWWSWDHETVSLFRDLDPVRFRQLNQNPISLLNEMPLATNRASRGRACPSQPRQLRLPPPARVPSCRPHLGRYTRRRSAPAPCRLLLRRIRHPRIRPHLLRRPRRSRRRSHQERIRPGYPAHRNRPLLRPGIFPCNGSMPAAGRRKSTCRRMFHSLPYGACNRRQMERLVDIQVDTRRRPDLRQSLAHESGPYAISCCPIPTSKAIAPGRSRTHLAALWRRWRVRASARNWCSASAACALLRAMGITPGVLSHE